MAHVLKLLFLRATVSSKHINQFNRQSNSAHSLTIACAVRNAIMWHRRRVRAVAMVRRKSFPFHVIFKQKFMSWVQKLIYPFFLFTRSSSVAELPSSRDSLLRMAERKVECVKVIHTNAYAKTFEWNSLMLGNLAKISLAKITSCPSTCIVLRIYMYICSLVVVDYALSKAPG